MEGGIEGGSKRVSEGLREGKRGWLGRWDRHSNLWR